MSKDIYSCNHLIGYIPCYKCSSCIDLYECDYDPIDVCVCLNNFMQHELYYVKFYDFCPLCGFKIDKEALSEAWNTYWDSIDKIFPRRDDNKLYSRGLRI